MTRHSKKKQSTVRAVMYIRYSDRKQDGSFSIEYQTDECTRYIETNSYKLTNQYIDRAKSGKKVAGREEFDAMCRDAAKNRFDVIVVFSLSRSFRNVREALNFCHEMQEKHGITIESVIEPIDMTSPHGKFSSTNLFAMHELQSDIIANHVKAGMHIAAKQGYFLGGYVPFGYKTYGTGEFSRGKERRKFTPHEEERKIIEYFFKMYADGYSLPFLQRYARDNQIIGRKKEILGQQTIARILKNEFYIGTREFDIEGYDPTRIENCVPAIIDKATWARVQQRHKENKAKTAPRRKKRIYELTGKIFCDKCGAHYFGTHSSDKRNPSWSASWYICAQKKCKRNCDAKNIRKDTLDRFVIDSIKKHILNAEAIGIIAEQIVASAGDAPIEIKQTIEELESKKADLVEMELGLTLSKLKKEISEETFLQLNKQFKEEIESISLELMRLSNAAENAITKEAVEKYLNDSLLSIDTDDAETLKVIFDKFVESIIVSDDKVILNLIVAPLSTCAATLDKSASGQPHYGLSTEAPRRDFRKK